MSGSTAVMLVGTCGAGKSTLGNFLLHGVSNPEGGFKAAAGGEAVTTRCESCQDNSRRGSPFKVIDTPGIPDPSGKTRVYFDCIVEEARAVGSLNAIVFVMDYSVNRNDVTRSFKDASVLLEQFNKLGCTIVIACRVPGHVQGASKLDVDKAELAWNSFVTEVASAAGLNHSATYFLGTAMKSTARTLRDVVSGCPDVPVTSDSGMSTFDELKGCVENRRNNQTRRDQLIEDVERLTRESQALRVTVDRLQTANQLIPRLGRGLSQACMTLSVSAVMLAEATAAMVLSGSVATATGLAAVSTVAVNCVISLKIVSAVVGCLSCSRSLVFSFHRLCLLGCFVATSVVFSDSHVMLVKSVASKLVFAAYVSLWYSFYSFYFRCCFRLIFRLIYIYTFSTLFELCF